MAISKINGIQLKGLITVMPSYTEDNQYLQLISEEDRAQIIKHTGIRYRRVAQPDTNIKDYFNIGISKLLNKLEWNANEIDVLICVTQSPQNSIPALSCQIHGDLGLSQSTICFDINLGCSGYVYGLHTIGHILAGIPKKNPKAILCCGDLSSLLIDKKDKTTVPIFSDAVSVTGIELNADYAASFFNLETAGTGQDAIRTVNNVMKLNGIDVFNYSLKLVPKNVQTLLASCDINSADIDGYIFHQANKLINDAIGKRLNIPVSKQPSSLYKYGNTASASIPITLGQFASENKCNQVVLCGFGVGFSVASALVSMPSTFIYENIEI
jgi:3-oxoacyl-[acyl-carrier-protein] synthase-3